MKPKPMTFSPHLPGQRVPAHPASMEDTHSGNLASTLDGRIQRRTIRPHDPQRYTVDWYDAHAKGE